MTLMLHGEQLAISKPFLIVTLIIGLLNLSGCVTTPSAASFFSNENENKAVWEARDQFVKIVPLEESAKPLNQHPVTLESTVLTSALESIEIERQGDWMTNKKSLPLLHKRDLDQLAKNLSTALALATSEQDIVFSVHTIIDGYKLGLEKVSVSGRVFYTDNKLNIIVGDLFVSVLPEEFYTTKTKPTSIDRSIHPHKHGSRAILSEHQGYIIKPSQNTSALTMTLEREDWISFDHPSQLITAQTNDNTRPTKHSVMINNNKTIEERLLSLEKLMNNKLISKEEYVSIREKILSEL